MRLLSLRKSGLGILLVAGILILLPLLNAAMKNTFELEPDEGIYLVIARLSLQGYGLYGQIWNDQPPLFTELLASWFRIFGASAYSGRFLNLLFTLVLLWGLYRTVKLRGGGPAALAAGIFLALSPGFLRLGISIMPGLPSLTLAVLSLYSAAIYSGSKSKPALFISAAFMALALATKFSSILLAPSIFLEIARPGEKSEKTSSRSGKTFIAAFFWLISSLVAYLCIIWPYFYLNLSLFAEQLFKPHLVKLNIPSADFTLISMRLWLDFDLVLLGVVAIITNLRPKGRGNILIPAAWLGLAIACFAIHRPIWHHYYLLVAAPLYWLAGIALGQFFEMKKTKNPRTFLYYLTFALVILALARIPLKFIDAGLVLKEPPMGEEKKILDLISEFNKDSRWIFTDLPVFAFSSDILVPPEIAVLSQKRLPTAELTSEVLKKYKPELILLGRFAEYDPQMLSGIQKDYHKEREILVRRPAHFSLCLQTLRPEYFSIRGWRPLARLLHGLNWQVRIPTGQKLGYYYPQKITLFIRN